MKTISNLLYAIILIFSTMNFVKAQETDKLMTKALKLSQKYTIVDGHIDLPLRLHMAKFPNDQAMLDMVYSTTKGDFDLVRAKKGGLNGAFMAVYIPASYQTTGGGRQLADSMFAYLETITKLRPDLYHLSKNPKEIQKAKKQGKFSIIPAIENGEAIESDLSLLRHFKNKGMAYMTLCHGKDNKICDSSYDKTRTWNGVSDYGYKVLDEMQKLGIMIDISHVSDSAFFKVAKYVKVPLIATHSSCRKFTPDFERNVNDEIIKEIARTNGLVMITFGSGFLDSDYMGQNNERRKRYMAAVKEKGLTLGSEAEKDFRLEYAWSDPANFADVSKVVDHIDHVVKLVGINHVGLGSDFDGVGDSLPTGLKDVSGYPNIIYHLLKRGYSEKDIQKICSGNLFRMWNTVLKHAGI